MTMFTPAGVGGGRSYRQRGRRRGRRTVAVLLTVLLLAGAAGAWWWLDKREDDAVAAEPTATCPPVVPPPKTVRPRDIQVNVYNATQRRGLAARVAGELRKRRFQIGKVENDPLSRKVTGIAEIRSSPRGAGAARTVSAQAGKVVAVPDRRKDASVDFVIGAAFRRLQTPAQAAAALVPTPSPRPSGC